jgi:hypothetical protein
MTIKRLDHVSVVVGDTALRANGAELVGEVAPYEDKYRLATCEALRAPSSRWPRKLF